MDEGFEAIMQYSVKGHDGFGGRKMSTVQNVFDIAIRLMDSQNETTGATDTSDTTEYKVRTCSLLNSILDRVYPASDTYQTGSAGQRPICQKVSEFTDELNLDERIATGVLPYGLAGLLLTEENPTLSDFFWQTFLEQMEEAKRSLPSGEESVENVYGVGPWGGIEYGQFRYW